ncbi:phospholipase A [Parabacteroides sp. PF5-9]|uniref:phospholipase A n=1 Tax=Parabacteroides sp. PF5-9 TaxID=1742404 RepID=UPI00247349F1|nr:phospholipase A [Parabacteroides sp. PF5-9]MDH6358231.1 phospholipase A1 [Parabacteroides sp. PF5-9]
MRKYMPFFFLLLNLSTLYAQVIEEKIGAVIYNADSVRAELDKAPYFSLFKDNYFVGGAPLGHEPTRTNSDIKFQISIAQRLTKSKLPFDSYLYIQFTQKVFWNAFQHSLPMRDLNFNPGLGFGHLIVRHNKYIGKAYLMLEHESNGKDSIFSRSWNRLSLGAALILTRNWEAQFKAWVPYIDSRNNKDILKYNGIFHIASNFMTNNRRFNCAIILTKRKDWRNFNTQVELSYKFNKRENQYLFIQYYNGYGENLLEYKQHKNMLRLGFVIKPQDFSIY